MSHLRKFVMSAAAGVLAAGVAAPALAAERTVTDAKDDVKGGFDIQKVHVDNTGDWITARSVHRNLTYGPHAETGVVSLFIDTQPNRPGPEFRFAGAVGFDGEYNLVKVRNWKAVGDPIAEGQKFRVNYDRDAVRFEVNRSVLARAYGDRVGKIRVAVQAAGDQVDWAPKRHRLYKAVPRD